MYLCRLNVTNVTQISLPTEETTESINEVLLGKISDGTINMGELIVPQKYEKTSLINNKVITEEVSVQGRKISLNNIRKIWSIDHKKYMRLRTDAEFQNLTRNDVIEMLQKIHEYDKEKHGSETTHQLKEILKVLERTRHVMFWHDASNVSNHDHFLVTVAPIYDEAVYITNAEYTQKYGEKINIQAEVEKPYIYIFGRCPSNDQQLLYSEERIEDILAVNKEVVIDGIKFKDVVRIFKGDNPAAQLEAGHQKGGNFHCWICPMKADMSKNIFHSLQLPYLSLQDRVNKVKLSQLSKNALATGKTKLYTNLKKADVELELIERNVRYPLDSLAPELQRILAHEMHGIQGLPALLFSGPSSSLEDLHLTKYEILNNEPLHDISNHIKNMYEEIPYLVEKRKKAEVKNIIDFSFNGVEAKNASNYRASLLIVSNWFNENLPSHNICKILTTLSEIQEILYGNNEKRSVTKVYRLGNLTFIHALCIKILTKNATLKNTERKFFGSYYHSLISHATLQYHLFSGRSINTEKEEAMFQFIKTSTKLTSNHHPGNVISNSIIRYQAKKMLLEGERVNPSNETVFETLYKPIQLNLSNTVISFDWIERYSMPYQKLLERQADYLLQGGVWWKEGDNGVEFHDHDEPENVRKRLHHFRSSTLKDEFIYLQNCWTECLKMKNMLIPAAKLREGTKLVYLST